MPADLVFLRPVSTPLPPEPPAPPAAPEALGVPGRQEWPKPKRPGWAWWHYLVMAVFGPMVLALVVIGADTAAHHFTGGVPAPALTTMAEPAPKPVANKPQPTVPGHDLTSYRAAIAGTEEQAFVSALGQLRADDKAYDFAAAITDAPKVIVTASAWLAVLSHTNPPPAYRPAKLTYMSAATWARRGARTTLDALQTSNFALLAKGQQLAAKAARVLSRAPAPAPGGS
jgi:hypothetical protein